MTESEPAATEADMDPGTAVTGAKVAAAVVEESRPLLRRVLGPASDTIGEFFADWLKIKFRHALRVAEKADKRLADAAINDDGSISTRTAMRIFDEAAYCGDDEEIVVEYLGGLLASSRIMGPIF